MIQRNATFYLVSIVLTGLCHNLFACVTLATNHSSCRISSSYVLSAAKLNFKVLVIVYLRTPGYSFNEGNIALG